MANSVAGFYPDLGGRPIKAALSRLRSTNQPISQEY